MKIIKILLLGCAIMPAAHANLVSNGGFEQPGTLAAAPGYQYLPNNDSSVTGWTSISDNLGEESYLMNINRSNNSYIPRVYQGTYGLALNNNNAIQTSVALTAGITYDLSFAAKANTAGASPLEVSIGGFSTSFANTTAFTIFQYQFTASATDQGATLKFFNPLAAGGNRIWNLDAVSLQPAPVPLPAATWSFLTGFMGLLALGKRKRSAL
ncbi:DUF642 domain-containing protein [Methylomonas sp. LW13]|uniref:DUF642 domain-containing protein n=1 Tax=unclassified Methylomonas TaxID=2608980 RepID=UPI00051C0802|nr:MULTISPECIES: DUF642 domain-containing protein [unclassified Methylomonas]PKD42324.1 DUF642 domain-containing protein [Methylomonas sp. Kb3]QBC25826.1 DUF642 domain-containing protein [Methylomonas sp. LW13]